jgi:trimeric autotransporter adhesin
MANTLIQLKYSTVTSIPPSLNTAEPAYSYTSNTLFIGTPDGLGTINIGGRYYTSQLDNATNQATATTLVLRDSNGSASFNVITANTINAEIDGNANSATQLQTPRFFNFSGDVDNVSVSFNGTANADFTLELTNTGVTVGTYGGQTKIPTFTVDEDGRITAASNVNVATTLSVSGDGPSSANVDLLTETLSFIGGDGITTTANDTTNSIEIDVDNTVIRTTGNQTITGDIGITGNLNVTGNVVTVGAEDLVINDPIIVLANNNTMNIMDIGYVGKYSDNGDQKELGLIHHAATNKFYLFTDYEGAVENTNILNIADPTIVTATLVANLEGGTVSNLTSAIAVTDGGTGQNTFTSGAIIIGNGTGSLQTLANTSSAGTYANASHVPVITVDNYGRVSNVVNTAISINTSQITSGILGVARGGTGANTFTTNGVLLGQGTSAVTTVSSSTEGHILTINSSGVPVFTMLSGGTF